MIRLKSQAGAALIGTGSNVDSIKHVSSVEITVTSAASLAPSASLEFATGLFSPTSSSAASVTTESLTSGLSGLPSGMSGIVTSVASSSTSFSSSPSSTFVNSSRSGELSQSMSAITPTSTDTASSSLISSSTQVTPDPVLITSSSTSSASIVLPSSFSTSTSTTANPVPTVALPDDSATPSPTLTPLDATSSPIASASSADISKLPVFTPTSPTSGSATSFSSTSTFTPSSVSTSSLPLSQNPSGFAQTGIPIQSSLPSPSIPSTSASPSSSTSIAKVSDNASSTIVSFAISSFHIASSTLSSSPTPLSTSTSSVGVNGSGDQDQTSVNMRLAAERAHKRRAIAGGIIGGVLGAFLLVVLALLLLQRRRRQRKRVLASDRILRRGSGDTWIGEPPGYVRPPTSLEDTLYTGREMGENPTYSGRNMIQADLSPIDDLRNSFFPPYTLDEQSSEQVHIEVARMSQRPELRLEPPPPSASASMSQSDAFPDSPLIQIDPPDSAGRVRQSDYYAATGTRDSASLAPASGPSTWNPFRTSISSKSSDASRYSPTSPFEDPVSSPAFFAFTRSGPHSQTPSVSSSSDDMRRSRVPSVSGLGYSYAI